MYIWFGVFEMINDNTFFKTLRTKLDLAKSFWSVSYFVNCKAYYVITYYHMTKPNQFEI